MSRSSKSSGGHLFRYLQPGYYLRRPRRLAGLCLVLIVSLCVVVDRQNHAREYKALLKKLQDAESEKLTLYQEVSSLMDFIAFVMQVSRMQTGDLQVDNEFAEGQHADPLILGLGSNTPKRVKSKLQGQQENVKDKKSSTMVARKTLRGKNPLSFPPNKSRREIYDDYARSQDHQDQPEIAKEVRGDQAEVGVGGDVPMDAAALAKERAAAIKEAMPISKTGDNGFGGLGATIIDSLDTLYIMGLMDEFNKGKEYVIHNAQMGLKARVTLACGSNHDARMSTLTWIEKLDFNRQYKASVFETTIRCLGGLIAAYDLSGESMFLEKATILADRLLPAWDTTKGIPHNMLDLASGHHDNGWAGGSILADCGTEQLEFIALSQRTGNPVYAAKVENVIKQLDENFPADGLMPLFIDTESGRAASMQVSFGAMGDSFYEYLLKVWVQGGKTEHVKHYREMWEQSMEGMFTLVEKSTPSGLTYLAERNGGHIHKMDHLLCFVPGMLVLGAEGPKADKYVSLAKELARTCFEFYNRMPSKLSGEHYLFKAGSDLEAGLTYNIGRPETVESLMYLWRKTHDPIYREWGWSIFQAFQKHCRVDSGYTGLRDVTRDPPERDDKMQSFFLAETLKYLYLLFSEDDVIPLNKWVFNTEAHPILIIPRRFPEVVKMPDGTVKGGHGVQGGGKVMDAGGKGDALKHDEEATVAADEEKGLSDVEGGEEGGEEEEDDDGKQRQEGIGMGSKLLREQVSEIALVVEYDEIRNDKEQDERLASIYHP
eukprot:SM000003S11169  [mRNA]  locus=s3:1291827:1298198:- [translate_table: standard]